MVHSGHGHIGPGATSITIGPDFSKTIYSSLAPVILPNSFSPRLDLLMCAIGRQHGWCPISVGHLARLNALTNHRLTTSSDVAYYLDLRDNVLPSSLPVTMSMSCFRSNFT